MTRSAGCAFLIATAALFSWLAKAAAVDVAATRTAQDEQILTEFAVVPTPAGALAYLESLIPVGDPNAVVDGLIRQLGDDEFERREQAAARLVRMPSLPRGKLEAALQSSDVEIRWRARIVLGRLSATGHRAMLAALRIVATDPPERTLDVLLQLAAFESTETLQAALHQALLKTTNESHVARLEQVARDDGPVYSRIAAACALQRLRDQAGRDALARLLDVDHQRAVLVAARRLGNVGDRRALPALSKLLQSDDLAIVSESASFVSALMDHDFGDESLSDPAARRARVAKIQRWLADEGQTAPLTFPVAEPVIARGDLAGNTLVATGSLGHVVELDPTGKESWRYPIVSWSAEKLLNGNVLIAAYQSNQILEVDKHGTVVWNRNGLNAMRAKPLADGHILIADYGGRRVLELNEDRQDVWTVKTPDNCFDAERLPSGNTVYCCPNLIREVDVEGQSVRDLPLEGRANSLQVLPNGRWLVANFQRNQVQEYDREGKIVWSLDEPAPCDAFRLKNGKTLVTSNRRAMEVAADGKTIREIVETRYGCARQ